MKWQKDSEKDQNYYSRCLIAIFRNGFMKVEISFMNKLITLCFLCQVMIISACGGGASKEPHVSSSSSFSSQHPLPTVNIETEEITVLSGATFGSLVGGTADGLSTPTINISCTNNVVPVLDVNKINFSVPMVSVLTQSLCTATVKDSDGRSASDTLSITILPKTEIGQVVGIFDYSLNLMPNSYGGHILSLADSVDMIGLYQIKALEGSSFFPKQYYRDDIVRVEGDYMSIDFVQSPSLFAHGLPDASMSIASVKEDKIFWLLQDLQSKEFTIKETIEVEDPCFIAQTNTYWANDMIVGQVNFGLTVFNIDTGSNVMDSRSFSSTKVQNVGAGRSLCHFLRGVVPDSIIEKYPKLLTASEFALPLTAIDYNTLELVFYGDGDGDNLLEELDSIPIETNSHGELKIVQVISRGSSTQSPRYLLVLLSDGNHLGEHALIKIDFDLNSREITQKILHKWNEGVPVSMLQGQLGGSLVGGYFRADLVVVLGTTEKSFFFDDLLPLEDGFSLPPLYGEPKMFNVGVGAGSAVAAERPNVPKLNEPNVGVLVSYPESGNVVYISLPSDEN